MNDQANKQTNEQANKQASKQASKQTSKQASKQTSKAMTTYGGKSLRAWLHIYEATGGKVKWFVGRKVPGSPRRLWSPGSLGRQESSPGSSKRLESA